MMQLVSGLASLVGVLNLAHCADIAWSFANDHPSLVDGWDAPLPGSSTIWKAFSKAESISLGRCQAIGKPGLVPIQ